MPAEVVCPRPYWDRLLREGLRPEAEGPPFTAPVGRVRLPDRWRLLVRAPFRRGGAVGGPCLRVGFHSGRPEVGPEPPPEGVWGELRLGRGPAEGRWWGRLHTPEGVEPITSVFLPGRGMFRLQAGAGPDLMDLPELRGRWSRTRGALGEAAWKRLTGLRVGVVGCGRLGSGLATALARNGVQGLVLVDPDGVELHNLGEGEGWTEADVGSPKVEALARHLAEACPWTAVAAVPAPVETWAALHALKGCDLIVCAADTAEARATCGLLAARYSIPLVEAGTGVLAGPEGGRVLGLEVRLILPGEACRNCLEGEAAPREATGLPWWADRMGSLRSLNLVAVGTVLLLMEALVRGDGVGSGEVRWVWGQAWQWRAARPCGGPQCLRPAEGAGDEADLTVGGGPVRSTGVPG